MKFTSPDNIPYPESTDDFSPIDVWLADIATAAQAAITNRTGVFLGKSTINPLQSGTTVTFPSWTRWSSSERDKSWATVNGNAIELGPGYYVAMLNATYNRRPTTAQRTLLQMYLDGTEVARQPNTQENPITLTAPFVVAAGQTRSLTYAIYQGGGSDWTAVGDLTIMRVH